MLKDSISGRLEVLRRERPLWSGVRPSSPVSWKPVLVLVVLPEESCGLQGPQVLVLGFLTYTQEEREREHGSFQMKAFCLPVHRRFEGIGWAFENDKDGGFEGHARQSIGDCPVSVVAGAAQGSGRSLGEAEQKKAHCSRPVQWEKFSSYQALWRAWYPRNGVSIQ